MLGSAAFGGEERACMPVTPFACELLASNLRTYGEDELAEAEPHLDDSHLRRIEEIACWYLVNTPRVRRLAQARALAAIEVIEGEPRPLRRMLNGMSPKR